MEPEYPKPDKFLLVYGAIVAAILAGGIAGVAMQDLGYFKIVTIVAGAVLLAAWLFLPGRVSRPLAACYMGVGTLFFAVLGFLLLHTPGMLAYMASKWVVENFPLGLQMATLLVWLLALGAVSLLLYSRELRRAGRVWFERWSPKPFRLPPTGRLPVWGAVALYINFVLIAMGCFSAFAFLLHTSAPPLFHPGSHAEVSHGALADFFLWHLLDAIPGLKVPETIRWKAPLTYEHSGAGWLLLLFKVMVIVPAVAGIGRYLKDEEPPKDRSPAATSGTELSAAQPATRPPASR